MKDILRSWKKYLIQESLEQYNNDGKLQLYHFSRDQNESIVLDPEYFLSDRNAFTRNDFEASNLPRVFFYVNLDHAEKIVKQSRTLYTAVVDASRVYDITKDPEGLKEEFRNWPTNIYGEPIKTAPAALDMDSLLKNIAERYSGAFYKTGAMDIIVWFEPIEAYRVKEKEEE